MGYSICYNPETSYKFPIQRKQGRRGIWLLTAGIVLLMVVFCMNATLRTAVLDFLLPGDPAVTQAAFSDLVEDVRSGESVPDAVTAFCREIIIHGQQQ